MESAALIDSDNKDEQMQRVKCAIVAGARALMRFNVLISESTVAGADDILIPKLSDRTGVALTQETVTSKQVHTLNLV
jgi:hypothetical protein